MATVTTTPGRTAAERSSDLNVLARKQRSLWQDAWYRLLRNKAAVVGMVIVVIFMVVAIISPFLTQWGLIHHPWLQQDTPNALMEPWWTQSKFTNPNYPLGTDQLGRDILTRLLWSTQISMLVGFVPVAIIFVMGVTIGLAAGFYGGWVDNLLMSSPTSSTRSRTCCSSSSSWPPFGTPPSATSRAGCC